MTIMVDVRPDVEAQLARRAAARGLGIGAYAASLLEEAVNLPPGSSTTGFDRDRALAAAARIRELRKGVTLGGLTIRELIDEGRP
jgi:hypothetical protein